MRIGQMVGAAMLVGMVAVCAKAQINDAQRTLQDAELALSNARVAVARAENDYNAILDAQRQLPQQVADDKRRLDDLQGNITDAQATIKEANAKLDKSRQVMETKRGAARELQDKLTAATDKSQKFHDEQLATFQATDEYKQVRESADAAKRGVEDASAACLENLAKTPDFKAVAAKAASAEALVKSLRESDNNPAGLAKASIDWIESKNRVERMKTNSIAADPALTKARQEQAKADGKLKDLIAAFEKDVAAKPEMVDARRQQDAIQKDLSAATNDQKRAETDTAAAMKTVQDKQKLIDNGKAMVAKLQQEINRKQQLLSRADTEIRTAERRLQAARADEQRARLFRDAAARQAR